MRKKVLTSLWGLLLITLVCSPSPLNAEKKEPAKDKKKKETPYEKLFKGKKVDIAQGKFATVYKSNGKIYLELPLSKMGKEMLLSSTLSSVSEPSILTVGMQNSNPLHIKFGIQDSSVVVKQINSNVIYDKKDTAQVNVIDLNYGDPSIAAFKIMAYKPDSSAVVFDFSSFMGSSNSLMPIIPANIDIYKVTATPKSEMTFIRGIKAFDNSVTVKTELNYSLSASISGLVPVVTDMPVSLTTTYNLLELPESKMTPRIADARVGINTTKKMVLPDKYQSVEPLFYTHRWKIVPKDIKAYQKGKLTEPVKPIVFYLDTAFPDEWKAPIREGVLRWNKAFEKIGFKNVLQVKDYPSDDPNFDPDDFKYSCIRYIPNAVEDSKGVYWVDPSTGEIVSASVFVYNNVINLLRKWRFVQTANVDPSVRNCQLDKKVFDESLAYVISHEIGLTLGLKPNFAASAAYPTESLRSASFTQKYGTTPSIMDYARFNYVAQPQDKGVSLTPPELGVYDYYAIDWNYRYFPQVKDDVKAQAKILEQMVDEKVKNPMYRYAPEQGGDIFDPSVLAEDLGNDPIKSGNYGILNLNAILAHLPVWIKNDQDSRLRDELNLLIAQQYYLYFKNVIAEIGGIYMNQSKEGTGVSKYAVVPFEKQRNAVLWALKQISKFPNYTNRKMEKKGFIGVSYYDQLVEYLVKDFFDRRFKVAVTHFIDSKCYSQKDFYNDAYKFIFRSLLQGGEPTGPEMFMQRYVVDLAEHSMDSKSSAAAPKSMSTLGFAGMYIECVKKWGYCPSSVQEYLEQYEFGNPDMSLKPEINPKNVDKSGMYLYGILLQLKPELQKKVDSMQNSGLKAHYQLLLHRVNKILDTKNN